MSSPQSLQLISDSLVKPQHRPQASNRPLFLLPWDLALLSTNYIQKGLLFTKPPHFDIHTFLHKLKCSLSLALVHFYPLAGRLATLKRDEDNPPFYTVYVDCTNSPGARFIHATLDATIFDIFSPTYVPTVVQSFFDHDQAVNHDGHTMSLLSVQVTELMDGVFIGLSMNHSIGDGTSFWLFFNSWSEIFRAQQKADSDDRVIKLSRLPVFQHWFLENHPGPINLPYTDPSEFIARYEAPELRERVFHFSSVSIADLKAKANQQRNTTKISSFQSLTALVWRCITRVRGFPPDSVTGCGLAADSRHRLSPPLSPDYFGNSVCPIWTSASVADLVGHDLGWVAWLLHTMVVEHTDEKLRKNYEEWIKSPMVYQLDKTFNPNSIMMGSSPRFNKYGNEFGLGKAVALRSGYGNKFDGKVSGYPGREGGGSIDLEICLSPETMASLEADQEFMAAVTIVGRHY